MKITSNINNCYSAQNLYSSFETKTIQKRYLELEKQVSVNPILSRVAIDILGFTGISSIINLSLGRSKFLVLESFLDSAFWIILGLTVPNVLLSKFADQYTSKLKKEFDFTNEKPLATEFKFLDRGFLEKKSNKEFLRKKLGLKSIHEVPRMANKLMRGKIGIMFTDFIFLFFASQSFFRFRNWLINKLSGRKGYSGEFTYANEEYTKIKAEEFEHDKKNKEWLSVFLGFMGNTITPLLCWLILRSKQPIGKGLLGNMKKLTPLMEYFKTVYMSKYLMFIHVLFNYNLNSIFFFARSINELYENIVKAIAIDFLFFLGDDIFAGISSKVFERKHKAKLDGISLSKKGLFGIPFAKNEYEFEDSIKSLSNEKRELIEQLSRNNFRIGIASTSILLGVIMTMLNALTTKKRIQNDLGSDTSNDLLNNENLSLSLSN